MRPHEYYAVARYDTHSPEAADALATTLAAHGCDDLLSAHPDNTVQVSYGPFISTAENLPELRGDARHALARMAGEGAGVPEVLNAGHVGSETIYDFTTPDPLLRSAP